MISPLSWSPDSRSIAFMGIDDGSARLHTIGADGLGLREVAVLSADCRFDSQHWSVSWSPDGSQILFPVCGDLYVVRADGSDLNAVTRGTYASWSPDGSRIAIVRGRAHDGKYANPPPYDPRCVLCTVAPDGSNARVLVRRGDDEVPEAVGPEGRPTADIASCSAGVVVQNPEVNNGLVRDCEALVEMIDRLAVVGLNWDADTPIAEWEGVTLDAPVLRDDAPDSGESLSSLRVRGLSLPERGLIGLFPIRVTELTELRELDLSVNELAGAIPPELGRLTSLRVLNLNYKLAYLEGPIPPELVNLTNLQELALSGLFFGPIPPKLGRLTNLETLILSGFTGPIPPELGNLTALETLDLSGNDLSGSIPPELGRLSALKHLNLHFNELRGPIPPELGNLTALETLDLSGNALSGSIPPELGRLSALKHLNLSSPTLSGPIPPELADLQSLKTLNLNNNLTGCIPRAFYEQIDTSRAIEVCHE